jgi:uncharacterized protein (DUF983 family)
VPLTTRELHHLMTEVSHVLPAAIMCALRLSMAPADNKPAYAIIIIMCLDITFISNKVLLFGFH